MVVIKYAIALALAACSASAQVADWSAVRGINYVPSTVSNDIGTLMDYNMTLTQEELGYASAAGFNAVRLFLHHLPWLYNSTRFFEVLDHFVATAAVNKLRVLFVVLDSCFGDVNADLSWITTGKYKNFTWIPNPGPAGVANETYWEVLDLYVSQLVGRYAGEQALLGWDVHNEPDFSNPNILNFLQHYIALVSAIDTNPQHAITVGLASASQQGTVQEWVRTLSFHNYDGSGDGVALSSVIASQQALAASLNKGLLMTESMGRDQQGLAAVLPAVYGCLPDAPNTGAPIGFFIWELMLGVDQFNDVWSYPYQGLVYPAGAGAAAGTWWSSDEQALLATYVAADGCPPRPSNHFTMIGDRDPSWQYAASPSGGEWTAWSGAGPRNGTLHYANTAGAGATITIPASADAIALSLVHKQGPDCGIATITVDGQLVKTADTYGRSVSWERESVLATNLAAGQAHTVHVNVTAQANPASSNAYVQIVGLIVYTQ